MDKIECHNCAIINKSKLSVSVKGVDNIIVEVVGNTILITPNNTENLTKAIKNYNELEELHN